MKNYCKWERIKECNRKNKGLQFEDKLKGKCDRMKREQLNLIEVYEEEPNEYCAKG